MKNKLILVGVDGRPSMKGVYQLMTNAELIIRRIVKGNPYYRLYSNNQSTDFQKVPMDKTFADAVVIRWGNRMDVPTNGATVIYNRSEAIQKATDKALSRQLFVDGGVRCPALVKPDAVHDDQYPVIARPKQHSKGKNFVILKDYAAFVHHYDTNKSNYYYSEFINKTEEFRVHCAHGKILAIMSKPAPTKEGVIAWNRAINGEEFTASKWGEWNHDVCLQALNAVKALGLDFGGVDVMIKDGKAYVLEVNTAPTLNSSPYVTGKYANYFDWLFKQDNRRDTFDYSNYKKVESFAWKVFNFEDRPANKGE